jgi:hypothetical protein
VLHRPYPMVSAALGGHLATVKWLVDTFGGEPEIELFITTQRPSLETINSEAMDTAARNGRLAVLVYLHEVAEATSNKKRKRGGSLRGAGPSCTSAAMDQAAANNHLEVVQWLDQHRREGCTHRAMDLERRMGTWKW